MMQSQTDINPTSHRIMILIVPTLNDQDLLQFLDQLPRSLLEDPSIHFAFLDRSKEGHRSMLTRSWLDEHQHDRWTLLHNPTPHGYGGNQKLGFRLGLDRDYDFVIHFLADGRYDPNDLCRFVETWRSEPSDVLLGDRLSENPAFERDMPTIRRWANRGLAWYQNKMAKSNLTDFHCALRGYSTQFLRTVPFEINTNALHFDSHLLLQAHCIEANIRQIPINYMHQNGTPYHAGVGYAWDVLKSATQYRMHQMGVLCSLSYRDLRPTKYQDKTTDFKSSHQLALKLTREIKPQTVTDIGCGPGFVAKHCQDDGIHVTGLDMYQPLDGTMSAFHRVVLEAEPLPVDPFASDVVLMLDIIEHLASPEEFLLSMRNSSDHLGRDQKEKTLILSTPNIAFIIPRLNLLLGRFNYAERGILDITHKRLFTRKSLRHCLETCGYEVERFHPVGLAFEVVFKGPLGKLLARISWLLAKMLPTVFAAQFLVICHPTAGLKQILVDSHRKQLPDGPTQPQAVNPQDSGSDENRV
ncbi:MAG: methyltransferase domain-containing protein [Phycisphaeraceae bacterium JB051]